MSKMDIRTIILIDKQIGRQNTGAPRLFAEKLQLSERAMYKYLKFMKEELNAPIEYSKIVGSYHYVGRGGFCFEWGS